MTGLLLAAMIATTSTNPTPKEVGLVQWQRDLPGACRGGTQRELDSAVV